MVQTVCRMRVTYHDLNVLFGKTSARYLICSA
jgi:hypothetical protein